MKAWQASLQERPAIVCATPGAHAGGTCAFRVFAWTLHIYDYDADLTLDGKHVRITDGGIGVIEPAVHAIYDFPRNAHHQYIHFHLTGAEPFVQLPMMLDRSEQSMHYRREFEAIISNFPINPLQAEVILWRLLWDLADSWKKRRRTPSIPDVVREAAGIIERELDGPVTATAIAERSGYSLNHLNVLFREHLGNTIKAYIIERRMTRARHLLCFSDLPIKRVAFQCGIPDAQLFNKTVRKRFGLSPSALRERKSV